MLNNNFIKKIKAKIDTNQHVKEVVKGSGFTFLAKIAGAGLGLISSLIIARFYGADIVGLVAIINSVLSIFTIFGLMGTNVAILRMIPEYIVKYTLSDAYAIYKKILFIVLLLSSISGLILYFSAHYIATYIFHKEALVFFLLIAAPFVLVNTINTINSETLRGLQKIKIYVLIQVIPSIVTVILLIFLTYFLYDKYNPVYIMFLTSLIISIALLIALRKFFSQKKRCISKLNILGVMTLSFPMFMTSVMHTVINQTDIIMLGAMLSAHEVGVYTIVLKLTLLTSFILIAVNSMAAPKFSQLYHAGNIEDLKIVAQSSAKLIFYSTLPIVIIYVFCGYYILKIYGEDFTQGYYALIFLTIGQFVNAAAGSVGYFLDMTGSQKQFQYIVMIGASLNIILNFIFIPKYGINGAAIASMLSAVFWNVTAAVLIRYKYGFYISYIPFYKQKGVA